MVNRPGRFKLPIRWRCHSKGERCQGDPEGKHADLSFRVLDVDGRPLHVPASALGREVAAMPFSLTFLTHLG